MRDAAGQGTHRFQPLTVPQLFLQLVAPGLGRLLFPDLLLQAVVHTHELAPHGLEIHGKLMQFSNAGVDVQGLGIVARRDGTGEQYDG